MNSTSRRHFLRHGISAILAAGVIPGSALGRAKRPSPSQRVTLAWIGAGPQGRYLLENFLPLPDVQVVAVCDVYQQHLEGTAKRINDHYRDSGCATYHDFRKLLAREDIDAVVIATPDHWHVPAAVAAAKAGKDIYLEKPMGITLAEDGLLRHWVQKKKRVFQFGTQQRSQEAFRRACEVVRNQRIGKLQRIYVWAPASVPGGSTAPTQPPAGLDYDFWLGPAPLTPCAEEKCIGNGQHKRWWYHTDYSYGFIAGWGVHPLDIALWGHPDMMNGPMTIDGKATFPKEGFCNTSIAWDINFSFADGVTMQFKGAANEYNEPDPLTDMSELKKKFGKITTHGTAFEGSDGWVVVDRSTLRASSESILQDSMAAGEIQLPRSPGHQRNWVDAIKSRGATICPIDEAVRANCLAPIGDIATRIGQKLRFDPVKEKFLNDDEANRRIALREMRKPWQL